MDVHDHEAFTVAVAGMAATFRREATEALFHGYWIGLSDLPIDAVQAAVARAIRECRFMPTASELRELAGVIRPAERAIKAWDVFQKAVAQYGYYDSVNFDDPVINATVRNLGGWVSVSTIDGEKEFDVFLRQRFEKTYQALASSGVSEEASLPLVGFHERHNVLHGHVDNVKPPVMIACELPPHRPGIVAPPMQKKLDGQPGGSLLKQIGTLEE